MKDQNDLWLESVYSDGTAAFVCPPCPKLFETVTIKLRFYRDAPVKHVFLRTIPNGVEQLIPMTRGKEEKGLVYYEAQLQISISSSIVYVLLIMFSNLIVTFEPFVSISIFSPVYEPGINIQSLYN